MTTDPKPLHERLRYLAGRLGVFADITQIRAALTEAASVLEEQAAARARWMKLADERAIEIATWRHAANEWADGLTSALQWLRNIRDGISTPADATPNVEWSIEHARLTKDDHLVGVNKKLDELAAKAAERRAPGA